MNQFVFMEIDGVFLLPKDAKEDRNYWDNDFDEAAVTNLNLMTETLDNARYILVGVPNDLHPSIILEKFEKAGFKYRSSIVGQVMDINMVQVVTPYDQELDPFPIMQGNVIKHYVDNFLKHPYRLEEKLKPMFEIWTPPEEGKEQEFKGMKVLEDGTDFVYRILGNMKGLFVAQEKRRIMVKSDFGLRSEEAKELTLSF